MYKYRRVIISVIAGLLVLLLLGGIVISAFAESSSTIKARIEALQEKEKQIAAQQAALKQEIGETKDEQKNLIGKKSQIDREIQLTQDEIDNKNLQIQDYNLLIAEQQNELDDIVSQQKELNGRYQTRIRSMEENGSVSYWSVLFRASSFADLLDRVDMVNEIAEADNKMMAELAAVAARIEKARADLAAYKLELETAKASLQEAEQTLVAERAEADDLMNELNANRAELESAAAYAEKQQESIDAQIAADQIAYEKALKAEKEAAAAAAAAAASSGSGTNSGGSSGSGTNSGGSSGTFTWPTNTTYVTCSYGYRVHPVTGNYSFHSGIDIGASYGAPIYAAASGTVTAATYTYVYGNYVTISHGNGLATLYGHMTQYIVSPGQSVTRGQVIGYVGSTGWSTGPHLHFTVYKNGATVNPMSYFK